MSLSDRKLETAILGFAIVVIGGMGYVLKTPVQSALGISDVGYEMPRPKTSFLATLFGLEGREISRTYTNPFAKKEQDKKTAEAAKAKAVAAKAATAAVTPVAKKAEAQKKPKVDVKIVDAVPAKTWGDDNFFAEATRPTANVQGGGLAKANNETPDTPEKMTTDQWRSLLRSQPTAQNVSKFLAAYASREVDNETLYAVAADLLSSGKVETEILGVATLSASYTPQSFTLAVHSLDQVSVETQPQVQAYLMSYASTSRLNILAAVLKSSDAQVLTMAMQVVVEGYHQAQNGAVPTSNPRGTRGDVQANSVSGYSQLIPALQQLEENPDGNIATMASATLTQLQSTVAAL